MVNLGENLPITNISWIESAIFCNLLSKKENLKPFILLIILNLRFSICYQMDTDLTEAEWEYVISQPNKLGKNVLFILGGTLKN